MLSHPHVGHPSHHPLRIGTVPYANAWPLTAFLGELIPGSSMEAFLPARLPFRLLTHHLDIALMPLAGLMEIPSGCILGNAGITCRGTVESVVIFSKRPLKKVRHIALDISSRSSVLLTEVLFCEFFGTRPQKYPLELGSDTQKLPTDAFLLIGDPALRFEQTAPWEYRYDLGELWMQQTGLPFVFATWIACRDKHHIKRIDDYSLAALLNGARDRGLAAISDIVASKIAVEPGSLPCSPERMTHYLSESVRYRIGPEELQAIDTFFELAGKHGLISSRKPILFLD